MKHHQTASISLHPPVIAGVSTGGERSGFFEPMKNPTELEKEIRNLRRHNERLKDQLQKAIEAFVEVAIKLKKSAK